MSFDQLNEQRSHVSDLIGNLLVNYLFDPEERLTRLVSGDIGAEVAAWENESPDLIGVHVIAGKGITNYLTSATPPEYQKVIEQKVLFMLDTLRFCNCWWDSTCQFANRAIDVDDMHLLCIFLRTPSYTYLLARDTKKLKQGLSAILDAGQRRLYPIGDYFHPKARFGAQVEFFDEADNNFCTYGNSTEKDWESIPEQSMPFLPWKMRIQVFEQREHTIATFVEHYVWWGLAFHWAIGLGCVIWLGWLGRGYAWETKKSGGNDSTEYGVKRDV